MKQLVLWTELDEDTWIPCRVCAIQWRKRVWNDFELIPIPICLSCRWDIEESHKWWSIIHQ